MSMWISSSDQSPLRTDAALTGIATMYLDFCHTVECDPFHILRAVIAKQDKTKIEPVDLD